MADPSMPTLLWVLFTYVIAITVVKRSPQRASNLLEATKPKRVELGFEPTVQTLEDSLDPRDSSVLLSPSSFPPVSLLPYPQLASERASPTWLLQDGSGY